MSHIILLVEKGMIHSVYCTDKEMSVDIIDLDCGKVDDFARIENTAKMNHIKEEVNKEILHQVYWG